MTFLKYTMLADGMLVALAAMVAVGTAQSRYESDRKVCDVAVGVLVAHLMIVLWAWRLAVKAWPKQTRPNQWIG